MVYVGHGVDREFHYWRDVIQHIAPAWAKEPNGAQWEEIPWVLEQGWVRPGEAMDEEYLRYILVEKDYGVRLAEESVGHIERARPHLSEADYQDLHHYFQRTLLTARLHRAVAAAYFGFRVYARGDAFRTPFVVETVRDGLREILEVAELIRDYPVKPPAGGQWNWVVDADQALRYYDWIAVSGWPEETRGYRNPYAGMTFPFDPAVDGGGAPRAE